MRLKPTQPVQMHRASSSLLLQVLLLGGGLFVSLIELTSPVYADKPALLQGVDRRADQAWEDARQIWDWAEPGYQEHRSSALLVERLRQAGFQVQTDRKSVV